MFSILLLHKHNKSKHNIQFLNDDFSDYETKVIQTYRILCETVIAPLVKSWIKCD